ncbi:MAG: ABC transporter ATP-binding protein [Bifidobacteriaceae bacterium]|nr:ABC transporter ATP-binding protein [Bifidobacteriaceae bacterium]
MPIFYARKEINNLEGNISEGSGAKVLPEKAPGERPILSLRGVKVKRWRNQILDLPDENIDIFLGDTVGLIGENGAGKTTLINCIVGKIAYQGSIERNFTIQDFGVQFQYNDYDPPVKVKELMEAVCQKSVSNPELKAAMKKFELEGILPKKVKKLSGGERKRLTLFLAIFKKPKLLILDEPTGALDYQKRRKILHTLKVAMDKKTVLISTHYYDDIEDWANKILILEKGKVVFFGTVKQLEERYPLYSLIRIPMDMREKADFGSLKVIELDDEVNLGVATQSEEEEDEFMASCRRAGIPAHREEKLYGIYVLALDEFKERAQDRQ